MHERLGTIRNGLLALVPLSFVACLMDAPEPTAAVNPHAGDARKGTIVSVELLSFDDESVAATLGDEWHRVEAGVFERPGATDRPDRVAVGPAGRRAELARARQQLATIEAAGAAGEQGTAVADLREQIAALEAASADRSFMDRTSTCLGAVFEAQSTVYRWGATATAYAINRRSGAAVAWEPYVYAARYSGLSFPEEGYDGTESIQLTRYLQPGCDMVAFARINVPQCPGAFLYVETWGSCSP
jgi:hypothetical protein